LLSLTGQADGLLWFALLYRQMAQAAHDVSGELAFASDHGEDQ